MAKIPGNLSKKVLQKYSIKNNAFLLEKVKDAKLDRKGEPRDKIDVIVGDDKQPDKFYPQVKLQRWNNEVNFSIRLIDNKTGTETIATQEEKIVWQKGKKAIHFYEIQENEELREGGYEFEVILKEKPATNKLEFTLNTKGLKFYYQPPMTEEKLKKGQTADETHIYDKDGKVIAERPENVVGSYVVYHESKGGAERIEGKSYKAGKVGHIYRPKITDANGDWTWGELNIDEKKGILTIEIDQDWLDKAVYPVRVDPTFGYDTVGGSVIRYFTDFIVGSKFPISEDGGAQSITFYLYLTDYDDGPRKLGLYEYISDSNNVFIEGTAEYSGETPNNWVTHNLSTTPSLTSGKSYWIVHWGEEYSLKYDTGDTGQGVYYPYNYPSSWPSPCDFSDSLENNKYSIYCTYTAGGGGDVTVTPAVQTITSSLQSPTVTSNVSYYIKTQKGEVTFGTADSYKTVDITPVNSLSRAFIIVSFRGDDGINGAQNLQEIYVRAKFNSTSQIQIDRVSTGTVSNVSWQVIEADGDAPTPAFEVQTGEIAFGSSDTQKNETITDVGDTSQCMVVLQATCNIDNRTQVLFRGKLTTTTNLQVTRAASGTAATVRYWVVKFSNDFSVQVGSTAMTGVNSVNATISTIDLSRTALFFTYDANTNGLAQTSPRGWFSSTTQITWDRTTTTGNCNIEWYVVQFPSDVSVQSDNNSGSPSTNTQSTNATISSVTLANTFLVASNKCTGTGTAFPRPVTTWYLSSPTNIEFKTSYQGQTNTWTYYVIDTSGWTYTAGGQGVTVTPAVQTITASQQSPTITTQKSVSISTATQTLATALLAITLSLGVGISPNVQTLTSSQPSPTISTQEQTTITPNVQTINFSQPAISVNYDYQVSAPVQELTFSQQSPTIATQKNISVSVNTQSLTISQQDPSISTQEQITITPSTQSLSFNQAVPTITTTSNVSISTSVQELSFTQQTPSITTQESVSVSPNVGSSTFTINSPTITTQQQVNISADTQTLGLSQQTPTIQTGAVIGLSVESLSLNQMDPAVSTQEQVIITPAAQSLSFIQLNPDISISGNISVSPSVQIGTFNLNSPTISAQKQVTIISSVQDLSVVQVDPTINVEKGYNSIFFGNNF